MFSVAHELKASYAFVERNFFLTRRYWGWEWRFLVYSVAGALWISLDRRRPGQRRVAPVASSIGAVFWNYLSVVFSWIAETIAGRALGGHARVHDDGPRSGARRGCSARSAYAMVYGLVHTGRGSSPC